MGIRIITYREQENNGEKSIKPRTNSLESSTNMIIDQEKKKTQITKTRNESGDITSDFMGKKQVMRKYYEQLQSNKLATQMKRTNSQKYTTKADSRRNRKKSQQICNT